MKNETIETIPITVKYSFWEMNNTNEKLSAVLAEMRADEIETEDGVVRLDDYADRIEAAVDRMRDAYCDLCKEKDAAYDRLLLERDKALKMSAPGNVAALREALESFCAITESDVQELVRLSRRLIDEDIYGGGIIQKLVSDIGKARAVAAPARNCDRFDDEQDAQLEFLNEVWLISVDKESMLESDKFENWTDEMRKRYARWLLAPCAARNDAAGSTC